MMNIGEIVNVIRAESLEVEEEVPGVSEELPGDLIEARELLTV